MAIQNSKIYLSAPYNGTNKDASYRRVAAVADGLIMSGYTVYSPVLHGHGLHALSSETAYTAVTAANPNFILVSNVVIVLTMRGWSRSPLVKQDMKLARDYKKRLFLLDPRIHGLRAA